MKPPDSDYVTLEPMQLRRRAASGVGWSVVASGVHQVAGLAIFAILARRLSPVEFGIMGMAAVFLEIVSLVSRAGLIEVLVQRQKLTQADKSTAFWSSLVIGAAGTVLLCVAAGPISAFFGVPEVAEVLRWLSLQLTINAAGTVHEALLRRGLRFRALALRGVLATTVSGSVGVLMAMQGYGVASLVAQALVGAVAMLAILWYCTPWMPSATFAAHEFRRQVRMGGTLCVATLLGTGNQRIVDLVVGHSLGAVALGFMRVAWRGFDMLLELAMRPVSGVSFPLFSNLQHDPRRLAEIYVRLVRLTAVIIYPLFFGAILVAPEVVGLAFGPQWEASIRLMQVLAIGVVSMPMIWFKSNVLMAIGHARSVLWLNLLEFALSFATAVVFCRFGLEAAAWGNVVRVVVVAVPVSWVLQRYVGIRWMALISAMVPASVCTALMLATTAAFKWSLTPSLPPALTLLLVVLVGGLCYSAALMLLYQGIVREMLAFLPEPARRMLAYAARSAKLRGPGSRPKGAGD